MRIIPFSALILGSVALSACFSQSPAQVVVKGTNFYGSQQTSMASAASAPRIVATPNSKPQVSPQVLASRESAPYEPRPSYGYTAPRDNTPVSRADVPQVTVKELEPLTASTTPAPASPVTASNSGANSIAAAQLESGTLEIPAAAVQPQAVEAPVVAAVEPVHQPAAQVLPEPQARVVAENQAVAQKPAAAAVASKGFIWPVKGEVIAQYGTRPGGEFNDGINIAAREGEPIVAAADGEVVYSGSELKGYGNMVILRHSNGIMTAYAHADRVLVSKGEKVQQGVTIATVGKTGGVDRPQVHFGIRKDKEPVDPIAMLGNSNFAAR